MKPFLRIAKGMGRYPMALAASILCSLAVAMLWGGNIGAVYPVLEVCLNGKSVQQWITDDIAEAEEDIEKYQAELKALPAPGDAAATEEIETQRQHLKDDIRSCENTISNRLRVQPYADYLPKDPFHTVLVFMAILLAATALKNLFIVANLVTTTWAVQKTTLDLQNEYTEKVLALDMSAYDKFGTSQLVTHFTESIEHVSKGLHVLLGASVREPLKIIVCGVGASLISWRLMLFTLMIAPPTALLISTLSRKIRRTLKAHVSDSVHLNRLVFQSVMSLPAIQAYGMEKPMAHEVDLAGDERMRRSVKISFWIAMTKPVTELAGITAVALSLVAGAYLVLNQQTDLLGIQMTDRPLTISQMLVFFGMMVGMSDPARKLTDVYSNLQIGIAAADRVAEILDEKSRLEFDDTNSNTALATAAASTTAPEPFDQHEPHPFNEGRVEFRGISFGYLAEQSVLDEVELCVEPGETVCIVGANGCGKSTLAKLLLRFYDPHDGQVLVDGIDLAEVDPKVVRRAISFVAQTPAMIDDTVAANIRFGSVHASDEQIVEAAKLARAEEFIVHLSDKYDTEVGFDGNRLSGGQKQRIALARAFLRNPAILILDEATNQIDQHSEQVIYDALRDYARDRTCIFVSHRPEVFDLCDRIVVMDHGKVVASGAPEALLKTCPPFAKLFAANLELLTSRQAA
ncbi:ABC transporter ATP-binding protein/permease [Stieleria sp. JC731]|uniref:ABC transporter ATP-binding protein n=1 Tax=Pirellulaceae TaxID=2691357 RepID=UPI001E3F9D3D|nr:ABC transporter ATP-binding protein [Stieleria sp. JC731]MCC9599168.1 ABC transporter ATP-binding protein/permease [Stieleria sp. JC731]